jgi:hypothetical protein
MFEFLRQQPKVDAQREAMQAMADDLIAEAAEKAEMRSRAFFQRGER